MGTNSWGNDLWVSKINQTINWGIFASVKSTIYDSPIANKTQKLMTACSCNKLREREFKVRIIGIKRVIHSLHQIKISLQNFQWNFKKKKIISNLSMDRCAKRNPLVSRARKENKNFIKVAKQDFFSWDGGIFSYSWHCRDAASDDGAEK